MRVSLIPDGLFSAYTDLTAAWLQSRDVRLLLCDLDYTLAPKSVRLPDDTLRNWIADMKEGGIQVMILSNNRSSRRVEQFCRDLGISYVGHAQKPLRRGFARAMTKAGTAAAQSAMLGDKLLTDMLGAHLSGALALMVEPAGGAVTWGQKVLHAMQEPFKSICRRKRK